MESNFRYFSEPVLLNANSQTTSKNNNVKFHQHPGPELILIREGFCQIEVNGKTIEGGKGSLIIIPGNMEHNHLNLSEKNTRTYCWFTLSALQMFTVPLVMKIEEDSWIIKWMDDLVKLNQEGSHVLNQLGGGILISILQLLKQLEKPTEKENAKNFILNEAIGFIENDLSKKISVNDLAKMTCLSASQFAAVFKKEVGAGPIAFQQQLRMNLAIELLKDPYIRIAEVALQCGYDNANFFSRLFRKSYNCSPIEWRKQNNVLK
ncbi:MAG: hypothetical protein COA79_22265 [Planctomycetota bacterium]|nr:MAG: hypothetical protein COA79_22265 [Planctomycetota bacterium]